MTQPQFTVVVRRLNDRFVREYPAHSSYSAKKIAQRMREKMDNGYEVTIETGGEE